MRPISANISSTSSGDSPSDGSSRMSSRGSAIRPRPMASICCSPPDSVPARWRCRSRRRGKIANTRSRFCARGARARADSCRGRGSPAPTDWERSGGLPARGSARARRSPPAFSRSIAAPSKRMAPRTRAQHAGDRAVERRFAGAVASRARRRSRRRSTARSIAAQHFGRAVAGAQARDLEQRAQPCAPPAEPSPPRRGRDRPRSPSDRRRPARGVPSRDDAALGQHDRRARRGSSPPA